jgi:hypothetical protein
VRLVKTESARGVQVKDVRILLTELEVALVASNSHLHRVPAAFTQTRTKDVHSLQCLDGMAAQAWWPDCKTSDSWLALWHAKVTYFGMTIGGVLQAKLVPGVKGPPVFEALSKPARRVHSHLAHGRAHECLHLCAHR